MLGFWWGILAYKNGEPASPRSLSYKNKVGVPEKTSAISIVPLNQGTMGTSPRVANKSVSQSSAEDIFQLNDLF